MEFKTIEFKDLPNKQLFYYQPIDESAENKYIKVFKSEIKHCTGYIPERLEKIDGLAFKIDKYGEILGLVHFWNDVKVKIETLTMELFKLQTGRDFKYKYRRYNLFHKPLLASEYCQVVSLEDSDKNDRLKMIPGTYQVIEL